MSWLVINDDGSKASGPHDSLPSVSVGQRVVINAAGCRWDDSKGGFVDADTWITKFQYVLLWTPDEAADVKNSTDVNMSYFWLLLQAWEGPLKIEDERVQAGISLAQSLGILTPSRAARIRSGLPPL